MGARGIFGKGAPARRMVPMRLWQKIVLLNIVVVVGLGIIIDLKVRDIVTASMRQDLTRQGQSIARHLADRIADPVLLDDLYQAKTSLGDVLEKEKEIEYIFVTGKDGSLFTHTFTDGHPPDLLAWNPLRNHDLAIQLLDTEKGYIRDVGMKIFPGMQPELHIGLREDAVREALVRIRNMVVALTVLTTLAGSALACLLSRFITKPLQQLVGFTHTLSRGEFGRELPVRSRDEVGELTATFNMLSRELAQYREKMQESYKHMCRTETLSALGRLSAGLAHELRNPLASIKILFQAFKDNPDLTTRDMSVVLNEVGRMEEILSRFLNLTRTEDLHPTEVDLPAIIDQILSLCRVKMKQQGVRAVVEAGTPTIIRADRVMVEQALLNLVVNALDAMPDGGILTVKSGLEDGMTLLSVSDTGPGIPESARSSLFDPFFTTKEEGTGLGLSIVDHIARLHMGAVSFATGETGTTFTMSLNQ